MGAENSQVRQRKSGYASRDVPTAAKALVAYFQGALLLAKTNNDATIIDTLADHAVNLVVGKL